jgi:hypothetical protein
MHAVSSRLMMLFSLTMLASVVVGFPVESISKRTPSSTSQPAANEISSNTYKQASESLATGAINHEVD